MTEMVLDKVRKLLAKAEATDNPNEAEAFSAKAAELIAAHRISPDRLAERGGGDRLQLRRIVIGRGAYVRARLALLGAVSGAHDCQVVYESGPAGAVALVAGFADDLDLVSVLYESLHLQASGQMAAVRRATPAATQRWRRSFLFGFAARVGELLRETSRHAAVEARRAVGDDRLLPDLPARAEQVRAFAAESFGRVVKGSSPAPASASGWQDGHRAGGAVDLGRARLAGRRAIGTGR